MENTNLQFSLKTHTDANNQNFEVLYKNGKLCQCPFRIPAVLPHPTLQGQAIINNPICSSQCQFFDLQGNQLNLLCSDFTNFVEKQEKSGQTNAADRPPLFKL